MPTSKFIGFVLAIAHLLAFMAFVAYLNWASDGQAVLLWAVWLPVDFPISLLVQAGFELIPSDEAIGSALRRFLPYFVHGVLGTIWWFYVPRLVATVFKKIKP